jgi:hypothetical protein
MTHTIRGANTGLAQNGAFLAPANNACPRVAFLRNRSLEVAVEGSAHAVFELGFVWEERYERHLSESGKSFLRDVPVEHPIMDGVKFVGHADFVVEDSMVIETKSVSSRNTLKIIEGTRRTAASPKYAHLLQLLAYMISMDKDHGKVAYGSYARHVDYKQLLEMTPEEVRNKFTAVEPDVYVFDVKVDRETGVISVDDREIKEFVAQDIIEYWYTLGEHLVDGTLPPRPEKLKDNPCFFCKFKQICENNSGELKSFLTEAFDGGILSAAPNDSGHNEGVTE